MVPFLIFVDVVKPMKSVGFLIVYIIFFLLWIELFELLCFIVLLKSVDIIPTEMVDELGPPISPRPLPTPATWMVLPGCRAASIPLSLLCGEAKDYLAIFFLSTPFCKVSPLPPPLAFAPALLLFMLFPDELLRAIIPLVKPCGWY